MTLPKPLLILKICGSNRKRPNFSAFKFSFLLSLQFCLFVLMSLKKKSLRHHKHSFYFHTQVAMLFIVQERRKKEKGKRKEIRERKGSTTSLKDCFKNVISPWMDILQGLDPKSSHKVCSRGGSRQKTPFSTLPWFCISQSMENNKARAGLTRLS